MALRVVLAVVDADHHGSGRVLSGADSSTFFAPPSGARPRPRGRGTCRWTRSRCQRQRAPVDRGGIPAGQDRDRVPVDADRVRGVRYPGGKPAVGRVELEQVRQGARVRDVVSRQRPQLSPSSRTGARKYGRYARTVDSDADGHDIPPDSERGQRLPYATALSIAGGSRRGYGRWAPRAGPLGLAVHVT